MPNFQEPIKVLRYRKLSAEFSNTTNGKYFIAFLGTRFVLFKFKKNRVSSACGTLARWQYFCCCCRRRDFYFFRTPKGGMNDVTPSAFHHY